MIKEERKGVTKIVYCDSRKSMRMIKEVVEEKYDEMVRGSTKKGKVECSQDGRK